MSILRGRGGKMVAVLSVMVVLLFVQSIQPAQPALFPGEDIVAPLRTDAAARDDEVGQALPVQEGGGIAEVQHVQYVDGIYGPTLHLNAAERRVVAKRHRRSVGHAARSPSAVEGAVAGSTSARFGGCPNRYLFVNTHTYGRHHNQLQEMMHLAAWAKRLDRTAVLGWFRFDHKWISASDYYNFSRIMDAYCLITPDEMIRRINASPDLNSGRHTAACLGQKMEDTPLKKLLRGRIKCRLDPSVPSHYNTRQGMRITKEYFASHIVKATDVLLVLSGQLAFFLRPGLAEEAALFGLLEPSDRVRPLVAAFRSRAFGAHTPKYFAIHLRRREQECLKEIGESREDGGATFLKDMGDEQWSIVSTQCAITVNHINALMMSLNLLMDHQPMFLGSDHQDLKLEQALVNRGAVMYTEGTGLAALAVDYFTMADGKYFTGNQLSSITQNICYRRLGRGLGCNGFIPSFTRYHSRNVETDKSFIRTYGVVSDDAPEEDADDGTTPA